MGVAAAVAGAAVVGAGASIVSGNKAAKASRDAADKSAEIQRYQYDTTRQDYAPYRLVGYSALDQLADAVGVARPASGSAGYALGGTTTAAPTAATGGGAWGMIASRVSGAPATATTTSNVPAMTQARGFEASPGYLFRLQEGQKAIERSAAARGGLYSGATMKAIDTYSQGVASDEYSNYVNRLAALAGVGQTATNSTAQAGQNYANGASAAATNAGAARASAYQNTGQAINSAISGAASGYLYNQGMGAGATYGGTPPIYGGNLGGIY